MKVRALVRWGALATVVAVLVLPVAGIVASAGVREFVYKDLSYRLITERVAGNERQPEAIASRLNQFIEGSTYPGGGTPIDTNAWNDLLRGIGWCDQDAWLLGTLLATRDIPGRIVFLNSDDGKAAHTMAEVYLDGDWRLFDPLYGVIFRKPDGSLASLADVSANLDLMRTNPRVRALPDDARREVENFYQALLGSESARAPGRWAPLTDSRRASRARAAADAVMNAAWRIAGTWGAYRFQDIYLALLPNPQPALDRSLPEGNRPVMRTAAEDPALFLYYRARNYHLYDRLDRARPFYERIIAEHADSPYAEKAAYFLAVLEIDRNPRDTVQQLTRFLSRYPNSTWQAVAHTALGTAYERLGDATQARRHYALASVDPFVDAAYRLASASAGSTE